MSSDSLASSPRPAQRRRYLEPSEMESENDSKGVLDAPSPTFQLKPDQMNFKCKTITKCLLANAIEVVTKALKDYARGMEWFMSS
ncbi:hypothetical protein TIFTF001_017611 [Ficus carica]|uniref:Uncharacterized protein n=1 Tax=Ficus carica TaxID=3494 RepID=A0AA88DAW9_FICCA|nr:hypothetical protein TIFTF001_017611 [Ficus carica]